MQKKHKSGVLHRFQAVFMEIFGLSAGVSLLASLLSLVVVAAAVFWFFHSAPPRTLIITGGPPGSSSETNAIRYQKFLEGSGVTLKILPSAGSEENLTRLQDPSFKVDIGFVQTGTINKDQGPHAPRIVSLGSLNYQPMLIFYRGAPLQLLSQLKAKRLVIGPPGSGERELALSLLAANGISSNSATFVNLDSVAAAKALDTGDVDVLFLMGDSASRDVIRSLLRSQEIHLYDFIQADGYVRQFTNMSKLVMPRGSIDLGKDIPDHDVALVGPTIELLAREGLHPALSDLLLEAAREIHGKPGIFRHADEFPSAMEHAFPISPDAARFLKSGQKKFFYRFLPFWLASLTDRILVAFVPMILILVPGLRLVPALYRWRVQMLIFRWYRSLLALERDIRTRADAADSAPYLSRLNEIETAVSKMKVPASFAEQFYSLRGHIDYVRGRILASGPAPAK